MKRTYRLTPKLVTLIVGAGLLSMAIALVLMFSVQKKALTESLGHQFEVMASITSARLTNLLDQTFSEATLLGLDPIIRETVEEANRRYAGRSPAEIEAEINRLHARWDAKAPPDEFSNRYKDSPAATFLRRYLEQPNVSQKYLTILVADRYGVLVASPYKPDTIDFSHQEWWRAAYKDGAGDYYVSDVSLDVPSREMDKTYMIQFAVPIIDPKGQQAIGALVVISTVNHLFAAVTGLRMGQNDHVMLANSSGALIFCPVFLVKNHTLKTELVRAISHPKPGWTQTTADVHYQGLTINGYAPVTTSAILNPTSFGGQRWYIFTSQDPKETYAPMTRLLTWVAVAGTGGLGLLGVTAFFIARRFTRPIRELQEGAKLIGFGNLDYRLTIPTGDEIEELSYEFNEMATKLKTAYTNLEQRVAQRTRELEDRNRQLSILYAISSSLSCRPCWPPPPSNWAR
ncbi:MAG: HAMP domain-containing protein [Nitrospirae bacterium]|nr:HAMP domain-containing protein [Nitrospirota bacterium]